MAIKRKDESQDEFRDRQEADDFAGVALPIPQRLEDEKYVISLALYFPGCGEEIAARCIPEDFHNPACRLVFHALRDLAAQGTPITINNVYQWTLDEADGDPFNVATPFELTAMFDKQHFDDVRGLGDAIRRLKDFSKLREIIRAAREASRLAYEAKTRPEEIISIFSEAEQYVAKSNITVVGAGEATQEADEIYDKLNRGDIVCIPSGFPEIDALLYGGGFWGGDNIVIAGETSTGKTTLGLNIMANACAIGIKPLLFSLEMKRFKVVSRLHSALARVPNYKIRPKMDERSGQGIRERLGKTLDRVSSLNFRIDDTTNRVDDIARISRYEVKNNGVGLVIVDYMGLCRPPRGFRGSAYERATEVSRVLTETSHDLGVPFIDLCQLRRATKDEIARNKEQKKDPNEPFLDMLKDSGAIENDADTVLMIWRNKEEVKEGERNQLVNAMGKIAKQRQGELGRFKLLFAPDICLFTTAKLMEAAREAEKKEF